jgi:hypothetical protein
LPLAFLSFLFSRCLLKSRPDWSWNWTGTKNVLGHLVQAIFLSLAGLATSALSCYDHPNGTSSLHQYPQVLCYGSDHRSILVMAVIIILVLAAYLTKICLIMVKVSAATQRRDSRLFRTTTFLFSRWRLDVYWYGIVALLRSIFFMILPLIDSAKPRTQIFLTTSMLIVTTAVQVRFWPWRLPLLNVMDAASSLLLAFIALTGSSFIEKISGESADELSTILVILSFCLAFLFLTVSCAALVSWKTKGNDRLPGLLQLQVISPIDATSRQLGEVADALHELTPKEIADRLKLLPTYDLMNINTALQVLISHNFVAGSAEGWKGAAYRIHISFEDEVSEILPHTPAWDGEMLK